MTYVWLTILLGLLVGGLGVGFALGCRLPERGPGARGARRDG